MLARILSFSFGSQSRDSLARLTIFVLRRFTLRAAGSHVDVVMAAQEKTTGRVGVVRRLLCWTAKGLLLTTH